MPRSLFSPVSLLLAAALALCGLALAAAPEAPAAGRSKLQRSLDALVANRAGPPGVAVVIARGKRREFLSAGVADVRTGRPPRAGDRVRIASVSKGFNAYLAALLAGRVPLDATVAERLPGLLPNGGAVTLRQLLQHTSGLADYIRSPTFLEQLQAEPAAYFSPRQLVNYVREAPLEFPPGSRYHYSDTDNIVAGLMAEAATGRSYRQLLSAKVFKPLGMRRNSLPSTVSMRPPYIHGYEVAPGSRPEDISEVLNPSAAWASGGIVSTPADLAAFVPAYVRTMLRLSRAVPGAFRPGASSPPGPGRNFAGLGIFRYRTGCGTVFGHTGSFPGYRLFVAANATGRRSVVFVVNSQIVPGQGSPKVSGAIRKAQRRAVCRALG